MSTILIYASAAASVVVVALGLKRLRGRPQGAIRSGLHFVAGPFPLSLTLHVLIALFLIITVHESRGRELIMVNLEPGGGGGSQSEMPDMDIPELPMPDFSPAMTDRPITADISSAVADGDRYARGPTSGIGLGSGGGIGNGKGHGIGAGLPSYIGLLRRKGLDVALVIDGTGSMEFVIGDVKARMRALVTAIHRLVPIARMGIVVYGGKNEPIETQPLTLSPPKLEAFLDGIQAKGGGEWEENVAGALKVAVDKLDWKPYAKKVIVLVADSPPEKADFPAIIELARRFHTENGTLNAIDLTELEHQRFEQEFEKRVHRAAGPAASRQAALPTFYRQTQLSYQVVTREGGGEMRSLTDNGQINQEVMILTFGSKWQETLAAFAKR